MRVMTVLLLQIGDKPGGTPDAKKSPRPPCGPEEQKIVEYGKGKRAANTPEKFVRRGRSPYRFASPPQPAGRAAATRGGLSDEAGFRNGIRNTATARTLKFLNRPT